MLKRFLQFKIRKDLLRGNRKTNERAYTNSLPFGQRVLYLLRNNKKKSVLAVLIIGLDGVYGMKRSMYFGDSISNIPLSRRNGVAIHQTSTDGIWIRSFSEASANHKIAEHSRNCAARRNCGDIGESLL